MSHGTSVRAKIGSIFAFVRTSIAALALAFGATAVAQDSKGTDFWLMFTANLSPPAMSLFITGDTPTTGTVSIPGIGFSTPFGVTPGTVTTVVIPAGAHVTALDTVTTQGIRVQSAAEVTVYGLNRVSATTDAYLGLPIDILGTEYINLGYRNVNIVNASQFGIVATQAATTVTITPTAIAGARAAGVPFNVVLNEGQTYQLRTTLAAPADLSGTIITSDKPIAVFGGHQCGNIPQGAIACDHIVEQLPPTGTWGESFVTMPLATRLNGDTFRILAGTNNTTVSVNGVAVASLNRGQFHERIIVGAATITASEPVLVAQYSNSSSFDNVTSDPFMMIIPPFEQFLASYTVTTPASGFITNFINVVAPAAAVGGVRLDGVVVPAASFTPIGATTFRGAQLPVALGTHNLTGPLPFGAFMYGFASFDSYGYPGGQALAQVAIVTSLTLSPLTATSPVGTQHCVDATVRDQFGGGVPGVRVDFTVTGVNPGTGFASADATGVARFCYTGANAGTDSIGAAIGALTAAPASKVWTAVLLVCDIDADRDVDSSDIVLIRNALGQTVAVGDPRDANGDLKITVVDTRACALQCTRPACAQ